jgi:hypothetical protein
LRRLIGYELVAGHRRRSCSNRLRLADCARGAHSGCRPISWMIFPHCSSCART